MGEAGYFIAPARWTPDAENPFSDDGAYGPGWSYLAIIDGDNFRHGQTPDGLFGMRFGREMPDFSARLADFLRYEAEHGRTVIVAAADDRGCAATIALALDETPAGPPVRPSDPRWMVHSTSADAWPAICACGEL
jgi:hypothetical protein